jgi:hypothetical protein
MVRQAIAAIPNHSNTLCRFIIRVIPNHPLETFPELLAFMDGSRARTFRPAHLHLEKPCVLSQWNLAPDSKQYESGLSVRSLQP